MSTINAETTSTSSGDSGSSTAVLAPPKNLFAKQEGISSEKLEDAKRPRLTPAFKYPKVIAIPSREVVQAMFDEAMLSKDSEQQSLEAAGLLSLKDVLLPAVAYQEEQALRDVQRVVQRDCPELTPAFVSCRKFIFDRVGVAMIAVKESRDARLEVEATREKKWADELEREKQEKMERMEQRRQEEEKLREISRKSRKRELRKKFPRNLELVREQAYLMTELNKLEREEKVWKEAEKELEKREAEIRVQEQEKVTDEENQANNRGSEAESDPTLMKSESIAKVEETVKAITLSSVRIQRALKVVTGIVAESDETRRQLYLRYRQDHQFHGYKGVKDTKGLLRALSQSQDSN